MNGKSCDNRMNSNYLYTLHAYIGRNDRVSSEMNANDKTS